MREGTPVLAIGRLAPPFASDADALPDDFLLPTIFGAEAFVALPLVAAAFVWRIFAKLGRDGLAATFAIAASLCSFIVAIKKSP